MMSATPQDLIGQPAPSLRLPDHHGTLVDLAEFRGRKSAVVYFYPKAGTAGCTAEACAFRDDYEQFTELGAEVIGVSSDSIDALARFAESHRLPFRLLSDEDGNARRAWHVPKDFFLVPGRVTYVIDRDGLVRYVFRSAVNMRAHVAESARFLRTAAASSGHER